MVKEFNVNKNMSICFLEEQIVLIGDVNEYSTQKTLLWYLTVWRTQ